MLSAQGAGCATTVGDTPRKNASTKMLERQMLMADFEVLLLMWTSDATLTSLALMIMKMMGWMSSRR